MGSAPIWYHRAIQVRSPRPSEGCWTHPTGGADWGRRSAARGGGVQLGGGGGPDGARLPAGDRTHGAEPRQRMLTVDYDRLNIVAGTTVIDVGCGAGRHTFEAYRRGADVIAFDQNEAELADVETMLAAMSQAGEVPESGRARTRSATHWHCPIRTTPSTP